MVKIPDTLIKRLQGLGRHFCLVEVRGKSPSVGGKDWQKPENLMFAHDPRLQDWLRKGGNYGVVGGFGLVIADTDTEELKQIASERLPPTFTVESPGSGGWHLYILCGLEKPIRLRDKDSKNIGDIQGPGKMVVGPGSVHPNGGTYKIIDDRPLAQITRDQLVDAFKEYIVPEREYTRTYKAAAWEKSKFAIEILSVVPTDNLQVQGDEYFGPHPVHGSETGRNFWVNPAKNCWHCFRHSTGGGPLSWLAVQEGLIKCEEVTPGALKGSVFRKVLNKAVEKGLLTEKDIKVEPKSYFDISETGRPQFVPKRLADAVTSRYTFKTRRDSGEIYVYDDGVYKPHGKSFIRQECAFELLEKYRRHYADEVVDYIRSTTYNDFQEPPLNFVNVENGILDWKTKRLVRRGPEYIFYQKLPVRYDPEATSPTINTFLDQITDNEGEKQVLITFIGYTLYRKYIFNKALILIGDGANGKTTFLNMVKAFLGEESYSTRSLHELVTDRFATSDLYGKLANICGDLPGAALKNTGIFKQLTGQDTLTAQKKFLGAFKFENYAKLMFSTNQPPEPKYDQSFAFFRRWILIMFPNIFIGDNADPLLIKKITTPQELSGLLNLAIDGLQDLLISGGFTETKTTEETRQKYMQKANPVKAFADACLEEDPDGFIPKNILYEEYAQYSRRLNLPVHTRRNFQNRLEQVIRVRDEQRRQGKKVVRGFIGLRLRQNVPDEAAKGQLLIDKNSKGRFSLNNKDPKLASSGTKAKKAVQKIDFIDFENTYFTFKRVKPAEPCELCGEFPVEWEITDKQHDSMLRRCEKCKRDLELKFGGN